MRIKPWILLPVALLAVIAFAGVAAQETADEPKQEQEESAEEMPEVITTEWLNKRYGSEDDDRRMLEPDHWPWIAIGRISHFRSSCE